MILFKNFKLISNINVNAQFLSMYLQNEYRIIYSKISRLKEQKWFVRSIGESFEIYVVDSSIFVFPIFSIFYLPPPD